MSRSTSAGGSPGSTRKGSLPGGLPVTILMSLVLLVPAFLFVWNNQDAPLFGYHHDDGLYYSTAKSIHDGTGYRIASLPGQPYQTKYPPGLPVYLSLAWTLNPKFPENLALASWLQFLWLPALLALCLWHWRDWGLGGWRRWLLAAVLATNAYILYFTVTMMSELPFTVLVLSCILLLRKAEESASRSTQLVFLAAFVAGLAFLMRTAGVVLLLTVPAVLIWQRRRQAAGLFAATLLPFVAGWFIWTRLHQSPGSDPITLYYTNYLGYHLSVFKLSEAHLFLWRNVDGFLAGVGGLIFPTILPGQLPHITTQVIGVAAIAGIVRMARQKIALQYILFGLFASLLLLVWSFPPNERFVLPTAPLIWAGFCFEATHLAQGIRNKLKDRDTGQRIAAGLIGLVGLGLILFAAKLQFELRFEMFPGLAQGERGRLAQDRPAYDWMRTNLPPGAGLQAGYDTVAYLYTGHPTASMISPVGYYYRDDEDGRINYLAGAAAYARDAKLDYIFVTRRDYRNDLPPERQAELALRISETPGLVRVQQFPSGTLYRVSEAKR